MATQEIHPSIRAKLDPQYVRFHEAFLLQVPRIEETWDRALYSTKPLSPQGKSEQLPIASAIEYKLENCSVVVFTPLGNPPTKGRPCLVNYHGGGWTLGNASVEISLITRLCSLASCVVVSVDYRLAPENAFPAAVDDSFAALNWVFANASMLGVDPERIAVGGTSSGGNLAAVVALKAAQAIPPLPIVMQLLIVPITDNTATASGKEHKSWRSNANTVWLPPCRMLWFRKQYLTRPGDSLDWQASPLFAPPELMSRVAPAWIATAELDILRDEGIAYSVKLKSLGVKTELREYKGVPHHFSTVDGYVQRFQVTEKYSLSF